MIVVFGDLRWHLHVHAFKIFLAVESKHFAFIVCRKEDTKLTTNATLNTDDKENKGFYV